MANERIIKRIEKLLALAGNNPSQEEAQSAMLMAQKLMAEHNLSMEAFQEKEPEKKEVEQVWVKGGQSCQWMRQLAKVIADNFRCNLLIGRGYGLVFIGLKEDVTICSQVFNFASHTLDRNMMKLRRQYRKQGLPTDGISGDYATGFICGLRDKFQEQVNKNNWGLILVKDNEVMEYTKKISSGKAAGSGKTMTRSGDAALYSKGYQDGKNLADPHKCITA